MESIGVGTHLEDLDSNIYFVDEKISEKGGFSVVYRAKRADDGSYYAVKVVKDSEYSADLLRGMKNEYDIARRVDSTHAIKYFYFNEPGHNDFPCYIIMEYAQDGTLEDELADRKKTGLLYNKQELINIFTQLVDGMVDISQYIVHRDIKPENILKSNGVYKISDYGISKYAGAETRNSNATMKGWCSALYYAPEAWLGEKGSNTVQMDIYAMGIIFYQLVNLYYPYDYNTSNLHFDFKRMHTSGIVKAFRPEVDSALVSMIQKMIEKSTRERYKSWDEIQNFLKAQHTNKVQNNAFVTELINQQNAKQLAQQNIERKNLSEILDAREYNLLLQGQIMESIYNPIKEIVEQFNQKTAGKQMNLSDITGEGELYFEFNLVQENGNEIKFEFEIISEYFKNKQYGLQNNLQPMYYRKKIKLWGSIKSDVGQGFNILMVEDNDPFYGKFLIMKNKSQIMNSATSYAIPLENMRHESNNMFRTMWYNREFVNYTFKEIQMLIRLNGFFNEKNVF